MARDSTLCCSSAGHAWPELAVHFQTCLISCKMLHCWETLCRH
jgi:hypothetical protein